MDNDFTSAEKNDKCTENNYSYTATQDICKASSCIVGIARGSVMGYKDVPADSDQNLMSTVAQHTVHIALEGD